MTMRNFSPRAAKLRQVKTSTAINCVIKGIGLRLRRETGKSQKLDPEALSPCVAHQQMCCLKQKIAASESACRNVGFQAGAFAGGDLLVLL
ncbi:hypothetical protein [Pseudomonas mohnii]